jgi:hypothetical protein
MAKIGKRAEGSEHSFGILQENNDTEILGWLALPITTVFTNGFQGAIF